MEHKRFLKLLSVCLAASCLAITSYLASFNFALAKTNNQKGSTAVECAVTLTTKFPAFLNTIISFHGFGENFIEYFKDIFKRNSCQAWDILSLDQQQDSIKKAIQQAYLKCQEKKVPSLEQGYYKLDAEIYYARHIIKDDVKLKILVPQPDGLTTEDLMDNDAVNKLAFKDLYNEIKSKYINKIGGDFDKFYSNLTAKYTKRKYEYLNCEGYGGWKRVKDKWDEFISNWGGIKEGGQQLSKDVVDEYNRLEKSATSFPPSSFGSFLENTFQVAINKVTPQQGLDEIMNKASTYIGNSQPTLESVFNTYTNEGDRYEFDMKRANLEAKYKALYLGITDPAVSAFLKNLDVLISTVKETEIPIQQTTTCSGNVLDKQC